MSECPYLQSRDLKPSREHPHGGVRLICEINKLQCLVDNGSPEQCLRYSWVKTLEGEREAKS